MLCIWVPKSKFGLQKTRFRRSKNPIELPYRTSLYWASLMGHAGVVRVLLGNPHIDLNKGDGGGWSPLLTAVHGGYIEIVQLLLANPTTDVNQVASF